VQELLRQVRETLGGEAKLNEIQSFSASGTFRRPPAIKSNPATCA